MGTQVNKLVKSMAEVAIPEDVLQAVDMKGLLQGFSTDYKKLDDLKSARAKHESRNFISRWLNSGEIERAKLDAAELQASFSKKLGQLMVLSVVQSKQLASQQDDLAMQQELIHEQTQQLAENAEEIQQQQTELSEQNAKLTQLVNEYFELKGLTQEGAIQLIKIANEVKQTKDELLATVDQQIIDINQSHRIMQQDLTENIAKVELSQSRLRSEVESELDAHEREVAAAIKQSFEEVSQIQSNIYQSLAETENQVKQALQQAVLRQQQALAEHDTRWQAEMTQQRMEWAHALDVQQMALNELEASTGQHQQFQAQIIESHQALLQTQAQELAQLRSDIKRTESGWQKRARWWLISTVVSGVILITAVAYLAYRLFLLPPLV
ncbi:hypothetical protein ACRN9L_11250 [Shewanella oncorhynchi]|uniref:hypothetical protein n=1 Tax=Shewanella oncorhynchi TaxID=2726434 RepID=UPI003D7BCC70